MEKESEWKQNDGLDEHGNLQFEVANDIYEFLDDIIGSSCPRYEDGYYVRSDGHLNSSKSIKSNVYPPRLLLDLSQENRRSLEDRGPSVENFYKIVYQLQGAYKDLIFNVTKDASKEEIIKISVSRKKAV